MNDLCGQPTPAFWVPSATCVRPKGHPILVRYSPVRKTRFVVAGHQTTDERGWPCGTANIESEGTQCPVVTLNVKPTLTRTLSKPQMATLIQRYIRWLESQVER